MSILSKVMKGFAIYAAGKYAVKQMKKTFYNKGIEVVNQDCGAEMFEGEFGDLVDSKEAVTNQSCDDKCLKMLRKHWSSYAVVTDEYNSDIQVEEVQEKDLLEGELSAQIFQIGCYVVRSAQRVYTMHTPGYNPEKEFPVDDETLERIKKEKHRVRGYFQDEYRITHEISAKHISEQESDFTYICRAAHARNYSWDEVIDSICTAKETNDFTDESASLFVRNTYIGSSSSVDTWYKFDPTGGKETLTLHPFDSNKDNAQFRTLRR